MNPRLLRAAIPATLAFILFLAFYTLSGTPRAESILKAIPIIPELDWTPKRPATTHAPPKYKPAPEYTPAPIADPYPLLASSASIPRIPEYNVPRRNLHKEYGLDRPAPLYIGFTRQWPILLQAVVSYITAGWPAEEIYVIENTGVHNANREGRLTLQNAFYLNHTTLRRLGVNVIRTPTLLSFSQMQNFFLSLSYDHEAPYYFYSHQDVVVFSFEDGPDNTHRPGDRKWQFYDKEDERVVMNPSRARSSGYRTIYENCLREIKLAVERDKRWGFRWFQYDHLTLVNRAALEAVGGWDSLIPYYNSDCDLNAKLELNGWSMMHRRVGLINDVSSTMEDLAAFFRDPHVTPSYADPNPLPPADEKKIEDAKIAEENKEKEEAAAKLAALQNVTESQGNATSDAEATPEATPTRVRRAAATPKMPTDPLEYFPILNKIGTLMGQHKYRDHDNVRNTWQKSQRGGQGEPYYYDPVGFGKAFEILTEAGRAVYREKWGHRDCDIVEATALKLEDQWRVEKDWED
ncbi:hypothetical protein GQ53DRAFT_746627 [Thozetella sp. PMI_491]|nr:hypothetical protein GQ53DRAFT_746627 [Thozetella sp. PMI_491]